MSDEKTGYISTNPNGDLLEKFHPSTGKQMDDPKPKPLEDQKTDLIASRPEALVIGKGKIDFEEILEDFPNAGMKQNPRLGRIGRFQRCMCLESNAFWIDLFSTLDAYKTYNAWLPLLVGNYGYLPLD